jgi:hypothetical protein
MLAPSEEDSCCVSYLSHHFFYSLFSCRAFFAFHMYLIQQGRTTNETFKWAALLSSDREVSTGHQPYPSLERPDGTQKVESISIVEDARNYSNSNTLSDKDCERHHGDDTADCVHSLTNVTVRKDPVNEKVNECLGAYLGSSPSQYADSIQTLRVDVAIVGCDEGSSLDEEELLMDLGTDTRQRSDSTFDGAPSAVIELCRSSEKRKIGSSSSGSTSSSKRYCYCDVSDDEEDYILAEDSDEDGDIVHLENNCPSTGKCPASGIGIEDKGSEGQERMTAATVAIIQGEAPSEVEEVIAGCIPASTAMLEPTAGKTSFPVCLSKGLGRIPDNVYKTDFLSAFRKVLVPPSTGKLRALHGRRVAVTEEMHTD